MEWNTNKYILINKKRDYVGMYACMFVRDNLENGSMDYDIFFFYLNTMGPD